MTTLKDEFLSAEHYLLAPVASPAIRQRVCSRIRTSRASGLMQALQQVRGNQRVTDQNPEGKYQTLEKVRSGPDRESAARAKSTRSLAATTRSGA